MEIHVSQEIRLLAEFSVMPTIDDAVHPRAELPRDLEVQVLAFLRMEYPDAFRGDDRFRDRLWDGTIHFVRAAGDVLVSHAMVIPIELPAGHAAPGPFRIGGVASVMTYPQFRGEGHGAAVMRSASDHIRSGDYDVGMLFCDPPLEPFYQRFGWRATERGRVIVAGEVPVDVVMTLGDADPPAVLRLDWSW